MAKSLRIILYFALYLTIAILINYFVYDAYFIAFLIKVCFKGQLGIQYVLAAKLLVMINMSEICDLKIHFVKWFLS